ncbi:MAG: PadR family transcriptional regulator [Bacteroidia bacterium]|nr:PadR family transcriptional regulator [Bacteroidia bacterium]
MHNYLGQFEELVLLTVATLGEEAYGVAIKDLLESHTGNSASIGALHAALDRMERKGFLVSTTGGSTAARGGRRKRYFSVTNLGKEALREARNMRESLWKNLPPHLAID